MNNATTAAENSEQTARQRGPGRPFTKGVSGNPGGRPRELADVKALAREHTLEAIETLLGVMRTGKTDTARAGAAAEMLSRGWGRPTLPLQHENGPPSLVLTDEQHASLVEALRVVAATQGDPTTRSG
jgi:hypothetical protein